MEAFGDNADLCLLESFMNLFLFRKSKILWKTSNSIKHAHDLKGCKGLKMTKTQQNKDSFGGSLNSFSPPPEAANFFFDAKADKWQEIVELLLLLKNA